MNICWEFSQFSIFQTLDTLEMYSWFSLYRAIKKVTAVKILFAIIINITWQYEIREEEKLFTQKVLEMRQISLKKYWTYLIKSEHFMLIAS